MEMCRHDYEGIDSGIADAILKRLRDALPSWSGSTLAGQKVKIADDFAYTDPIDGSTTEHQGIRIVFENGSRIVFRLSGTGTEGATLRIYLERYERDPSRHSVDPQEALKDLIGLAEELCEIRKRTGMTAPTVIT